MEHLEQIVFKYAPIYFRELVKSEADKEYALSEIRKVFVAAASESTSDASIEEAIDEFEKSLSQ